MSLRILPLGVLLAVSASAQDQRTEAVSKKAQIEQQDAQKKADDQGKLVPDNKPKKPEEKWFSGMAFRNIGPFRGGRSLTVSGIAHDPNTYYFGGVGGGIWKSTDGAITWSSVFDKEGTSSIGSLAVAPSDPNIVYAGTGETALRGNISHGDGVYKTIDGGKTWKNTGLKDSRAIGKVIVHPSNPDIVFVAAFGHQYGPNTERGSVPHTGWRQELDARALQGRQERRCRYLVRSAQSKYSVRHLMAGLSHAVEPRKRRPGEWPVPFGRRRQHLEATPGRRAA